MNIRRKITKLFRAGSPLSLFSNRNSESRQFTRWESPKDDWNISSLPRSIVPHLKPRNGTHNVPMGRPEFDGKDDTILERLQEMKAK